MQVQVLSQISKVNFSPFRMTTFSKQFVPDRASCSLSERQTVHLFIHIQHSKTLTLFSIIWFSPTLLHTPVQLCKYIIQKNITKYFQILCEYITYCIKCVVASSCHPFSFLGGKRKKVTTSFNMKLLGHTFLQADRYLYLLNLNCFIVTCNSPFYYFKTPKT